MAQSVNKVILVCRAGADPEIRATKDGKQIANLRVATSETWKDKSGERQERTSWHTVVSFNENITKVIEQYVKKGSLLYIEGALATRKWTDQSGQERYTTEVVLQAFNGQLVLLGSPGDRKADADPAPAKAAAPPSKPTAAPVRKLNEIDDQIPFIMVV